MGLNLREVCWGSKNCLCLCLVDGSKRLVRMMMEGEFEEREVVSMA